MITHLEQIRSIVAKGMLKYKLYDEKTNTFCIAGAISQALTGHHSSASWSRGNVANIVTKLAAQLPPSVEFNDSIYRLVAFNNAPETTTEMLVALIDRAIAAEKGASPLPVG